MKTDPPPITRVSAAAWRGGTPAAHARAVPDEVAVALTYDHATFAVMMATPAELEDFAIGFSLSEGIIGKVSDITGFEAVVVEQGIDCRMTLSPARRDALDARRRRIAGPVGCGSCGLDSLKEADRPIPRIKSAVHVAADVIADAVSRMSQLQTLNIETRAVHAAAFFDPSGNDILLREDIGRHNALDKLIGAVLRRGDDPSAGAVFLTSRVSLDLIQKAAVFGAAILVAVSVPSASAVRAAEAAGITLIAVARHDGFEIFTHPQRVTFGTNTE
jgi:FdhD protein